MKKKIAITGHTGQVGQALVTECILQGYEVMPFSRANGYDITVFPAMGKLIAAAKDCDIFVNNAYSNSFHQVELLYRLYDAWKTKKKTIINIGTTASGYYEHEEPWVYGTHKSALDDACRRMQSEHNKHPLKVINIKPYYIGKESYAIPPEQLAKDILWVASHPRHIAEITIR